MRTFPGIEWNLADEAGNVGTWDKVQVAVLMDIRRELQTLNRLLMCPNFTSIPHELRVIRKNTTKRKARR